MRTLARTRSSRRALGRSAVISALLILATSALANAKSAPVGAAEAARRHTEAERAKAEALLDKSEAEQAIDYWKKIDGAGKEGAEQKAAAVWKDKAEDLVTKATSLEDETSKLEARSNELVNDAEAAEAAPQDPAKKKAREIKEGEVATALAAADAARALFDQALAGRDEARKEYRKQPRTEVAFQQRSQAEDAVALLTGHSVEAGKAEPPVKAVVEKTKVALSAAKAWLAAAVDSSRIPLDDDLRKANDAKRDAYLEKLSDRNAAVAEAGGIREPLINTDHFYIQTGVVSLAPYTIKDTRNATQRDGTPILGPDGNPEKVFHLDDSSDVDVLAFVEFRYRNRLSWNRARLDKSQRSDGKGWFLFCDQDRPESQGWWKRIWNAQCVLSTEIDLRAGFTFAGQGDPSGSVVVGSGDFNTSFVLGWPLFHRDVDFGPVSATDAFSLEIGYEVVTDRAVQDVHDRLSLGLGYSLGMFATPLGFPGTAVSELDDRVYEISIRGSINRMDSPDQFSHDILVDGDREVRVHGGANPDFDTSWEFGMDFDAQLPVGRRSYLTVSAGVFDGDPNPWFVRLGATVPVDGIIGLFRSLTD